MCLLGQCGLRLHQPSVSALVQELLPEKRFLYYPGLAKAAGSQALGARIAALAPDVHIFGHTHFSWDATLDGGCTPFAMLLDCGAPSACCWACAACHDSGKLAAAVTLS